jgi:hypothetical protein
MRPAAQIACDFGPVRLMSFGEARWLLPDGEFTYGEFHLWVPEILAG